MVFNSKTNEMVSYVNMFGACMIATIFRKCDGRLAVRVERDWVSKWKTSLMSHRSHRPSLAV